MQRRMRWLTSGYRYCRTGAGDRRRPFQEALARHRIAKNPNDASAYLSLGAVLLSRLHVQEAIPELRRAAQLDPRMPEAHDMLGAALQNTGQLTTAINEYQQALQIAPQYASARYNLARALERLGDKQGALLQMKSVQQAYPNDARIAAELRRLQSAITPP